jgi:CBS domain-containing protein
MSKPSLRFEDLVIAPTESLKSALRRMTDNRKGILFVCDGDLHLMGVLTDGDVRRALLDDTLLVAPVIQTMNTDPIVASSNAQAVDYARRYSAVAVPVVDPDGLVQEFVVTEGAGFNTLSRRALCEGETVSGVANLNAVAVIPARGGSKRIPQKNLAVAGGKSLLAWAIQASQERTPCGPGHCIHGRSRLCIPLRSRQSFRPHQ